MTDGLETSDAPTTCVAPLNAGTNASIGLTPPARSALADDSRGDQESAAARGTRRVLLLDDDPSFKEIIQDFLTENGYTVVAVQNGAEGVREVLAGDFSVILCDMMMPALPGNMFYRAVEQSRPHLCRRFIFMTGHRGDGKANDFIEGITGFVLRKPFQLQDLLDAIAVAEVRGTFRSVFDSSATQQARPQVRPPVSRRPARETPAPPVSKVAPALTKSRPRVEPARSVPDRSSATPAVEQQGKKGGASFLEACLGLAFAVVLVMVAAGWYIGQRVRTGGLAADLQALEMQWMALSRQHQRAETARTGQETRRQRQDRVAEDRAAPGWAAALEIVALAAGTGVELLDLQALRSGDDPGACELRIDGVCTGRTPRMTADQFRQRLETNLQRHFGRDGVTSRFERLEDEPSSPPALPDRQCATFTITATAGAIGPAAPGRSEAR